MREMITFSRVSKTYGNTVALQPLELSIAKGERVAIVGQSGCGKSTLLRLIVGLISPSTGTVSVNGSAVEPQNLMTIRRSVGYVIQEGGLFPHMTARQNVQLLSHVMGWPRNELSARTKVLCEVAHFPEDLLDRLPTELSGGQRQRVSLMRALQTDPEVLLLDEPLGALDSIIRSSLQQELHALFRNLNKTVVLVTHDLAEAAYLCERIILMRNGEVVQDGDLTALREHPADSFAKEFVAAQKRPVEL